MLAQCERSEAVARDHVIGGTQRIDFINFNYTCAKMVSIS